MLSSLEYLYSVSNTPNAGESLKVLKEVEPLEQN